MFKKILRLEVPGQSRSYFKVLLAVWSAPL